MERTYTKKEIKARLKWFHGQEFEKYPFIEEDSNQKNIPPDTKTCY